MPTKAEYIAEGVQAERTRIQAILESPEGVAHPKTAISFALYSPMTPELAIATMAGLPKESVFLEAMEGEGPIGIRPGAAASTGSIGSDSKAARLAEIKAGSEAFNKVRGYTR